MKKALIGIVLVLVLFICIFLGLKYVSLGTKNARLGATLISIEVPKLSSLKSECCEYEAIFKTIRGKDVIEKELNNIMNKYMKVSCNGRDYYYDMKNNITYTDYEVTSKGISTEFKLAYVRNNICGI